MRLSIALVLCAASLLPLGACTQSAPPTSQEPSSTVSVAASPSASPQGEYTALLDVVSKTQTAVEANDFANAQQEFETFESVWAPVEDGIKAKSSESYDAIEQDMDAVNTALRAADANQAIAALKTMTEHIQLIP